MCIKILVIETRPSPSLLFCAELSPCLFLWRFRVLKLKLTISTRDESFLQSAILCSCGYIPVLSGASACVSYSFATRQWFREVKADGIHHSLCPSSQASSSW
ncbi:hypothetical protein CK203_004013 [Vitis vinifera]|uniref:Uncharacterized protein n=1 Tax=Vitis vinifera TaxID=29760 RepID=A0A438K9T8_VITVI|nr:hypothetical protein CK203_068805 [Vitis vinifera]RVX17965.1 hypothetical protein CK203_004013 [Vitis vinifera]